MHCMLYYKLYHPSALTLPTTGNWAYPNSAPILSPETITFADKQIYIFSKEMKLTEI